jgi:hypothetical protein
MLKSAALAAIAAVIVACAWPLLYNRGTTEVALQPAKAPESPVAASRQPAEQSTITTAPKQVTPTPTSPPPAETQREMPAPLTSQPPSLPPSTEKPPVASAPPQNDALRPLPPPANTQPEKSTPPSPTKDEDYFDISSVRVYGFSPTSLEFRITGKQLNDNLTLRKDASVVWVVKTSGAHRIDNPFKMDAQSSSVSIAGRVALDFNDAWPLEVFIAERWYNPTTGSRRLSNIVRVTTTDVRAEPAPRPRSTAEKTILLRPDVPQ